MRKASEDDGVIFNDRLNLIIGTRTLSLHGSWQFEEELSLSKKIGFDGSELNFDILANLNEKNYLIHPADVVKIEALLKRRLEDDNVDFHIRVITPSGDTRPVHGVGTFVSFENVYQKKFTDLDEFSNTDQLQLKIFKYAEQVARIGSWTWNLKSAQIFFSDHFFRLIGITPQSKNLSWTDVAEYLHPEDKERYLHERATMEQSAEAFATDYKIIRADGAVRYLKDKIDLFETHTGELFFIGITHDVTREVLAQLESKRQKELLKKSLDTISQMVWMADAKGNVQFLNDQWLDYTGITIEKLKNFQIKDLGIFHPDQAKEILPGLQVSFELGVPFQAEVLLRNASGEYRWHLAAAQPIHDEKNQIETWVGSFVDIHDVFVSERKLKQSNDLLDGVFNASVSGILVLNAVLDDHHVILDFTFTLQNTRSKEMMLNKDLISKSLLTEFPGMRESLFKNYKAVVQSKIPQEFEYYYCSDGLDCWFHTSICSVNGNLVVTFLDITERRQKEIQLQETRQFIETLNDSSIDRTIVIDRELRCMLWNKSFEKSTGLKKLEALGKHLFDIFPSLRQRPKFLETLHAALDGRPGYLESEQGMSGDETVDVHLVPLIKVNKVYAVLCVVHDVTERVKAHQDLKQLNESLKEKNFELESINEELSTFAFIASHDLREPLRKMQLFSDILVEREAIHVTLHGKEIFGKMMGSINRMNSLLDEILTFSRVSSGKPKMLHFNIDQIFDIVKSDLSEIFDQKKVEIVADHMPDFYGNPLQFSLLLSNLISNAIKFQKPDSIPEIKISCKTIPPNTVQHPRVIPDKEYLLVEVKDNGIGLEEKYVQKIFQIFQRLHNATQFPGTGMGLAICKKVIENHHGFITVKSTPGEGSTFSCHFPILSPK